MTVKIAALNAEHCHASASVDVLPGRQATAEELYLAVSEKPGDENTGYLVAERDDEWWCSCQDYRYRCVDGDDVVDECKHINAVRLRTRQVVEDDQATLLGGGGDR